MSVLPPELEATYEILEELREGGMGAVYKARHRQLEDTCVIKVIRAKLEDADGARERFLSEAKKGKQLRHPNIAEFHGLFMSAEGKACLVMEYIAGTNLRELLIATRGPLTPKLVVTIGVQALAALGYLHARKLVHRDISPDNLMLTKDAEGAPLVKLIDLGIAKSLDETSGLTQTGLFVGKVGYASPEQFAQIVDARSDLYSLGVVLYELLTGTMPITGANTMALLANIQSKPPRPFSETDPKNNIPQPLRQVILQALEKKPEKRLQSADEFSAALQRSLASKTATVAGAAPAATLPTVVVPKVARETIPVDRRPRPSPWPLAALAALFVIGAVFSVQMFRTSAVPPPDRPRVRQAVAAAITPAQKQELEGMLREIMSAGRNPSPDDPVVTGYAKGKNLAADSVRQFAANVIPRLSNSMDAVTRGRKLAAAGDVERAYDAFKAATKSDPANAYAWANLGGAAALLKKPGEARSACERALEIDSSNWLAHYNLACQLTRSGRRDEGLRHVSSAVAELRRQARNRGELETVFQNIRADDALGELRNDPRFQKLLAID